MVLGRRGRSVSEVVLGPIVRGLARAGVSPDAVTVTGTVATIAASFGLLARGYLVAGTLVLVLVMLTDSVDGLLARETGKESQWGAFLDSVMDRLGDAAVFSAVAIYTLQIPGALGTWTSAFALALLPLALIVSYVRARAESIGFTANVGIAERSDRLLITGIGTLSVGLGAPVWVLTVALGYAAVASLITVIQRIVAVRKQYRATLATPTAGSPAPGPVAGTTPATNREGLPNGL